MTGVLTGVLWGLASSGEVFSCDWEEEEDECVLSLELLRVSVLVLVFFIFLRLASGALSTVWRRKPSRLHLLKAWKRRKEGGQSAAWTAEGALACRAHVEGGLDAGVHGGGGGAQDVRRHERVGGQLAVVLQPRVVAQAAHLDPLAGIHGQQL